MQAKPSSPHVVRIRAGCIHHPHDTAFVFPLEQLKKPGKAACFPPNAPVPSPYWTSLSQNSLSAASNSAVSIRPQVFIRLLPGASTPFASIRASSSLASSPSGVRNPMEMEAALGALCRAGGWSYAAVWRFHPHDPRWAVWVDWILCLVAVHLDRSFLLLASGWLGICKISLFLVLTVACFR